MRKGNDGKRIGRDDAGAAASHALGADIIGYVDSIRALHDADAVVAAMGRALAKFGIEYFGIAHQSGDAAAFKRGIVVDVMNHDWERHYFANGYADDNQSMNGVLNDKGPIYWSELSALPQYGKRFGVMANDAKSFGLFEGLCIPILRPKRTAAVASFQGRHVDVSQPARITMYAIASFSYDRLVRIGAWPNVSGVNLSVREAECLVWVSQGKTDGDIGEVLSISENTVHWHIEQAKTKLGVATRMQAVVRAIQEGRIAP